MMVNEKNIPERLKQEKRWVLWKPEVRSEKPTKVPVAPNGCYINATDSTNWLTFDDAVRYARERGWGVGFALGDGYVGIDIDRCYVDDERGHKVLTPLADHVARSLQSYTERSPSGEGIHIIVWAGRDIAINRVGPVEVYTRGRFFTITGDAATGSGVNDATQGLAWLEHQLTQWRMILQHVRRKRREFIDAADPYSRYSSPSEADMALAGEVVRKLADLGAPHQTIEAEAMMAMWLFPKMCRGKWLRTDYLRDTIKKAIEGLEEQKKEHNTEKKKKLIGADILELLRSDDFPVDVRTNILGRIGECYLDGSWMQDAWERASVEIENQLRKRGFQSTYQAIEKAIGARVEENVYNPMKEWLEGLSWDGTPRMERWLIDFFGVEDTLLAREAAKRFLIGAVARALEPGCQMDWMLVLYGPQGIGKSSGIRTLFGKEWTTSWSFDSGASKRDNLLALYTGWCAEVAELAGMDKRDSKEMRDLISALEDPLRRPYGRGSSKYPRHTVLIGTTNDSEILRDETGNRRFIIMACGAPQVDLSKMQAAREQLWAEALHAYRREWKWWWDLDDLTDLRRQIAEMHRRFERPLHKEEAIRSFCMNPAAYALYAAGTRIEETAKRCVPGFVNTGVIADIERMSRYEVARVLRKMGYEQTRINNERFWYDPAVYLHLKDSYSSWDQLLEDRAKSVNKLQLTPPDELQSEELK
jgi:hypothetical protein